LPQNSPILGLPYPSPDDEPDGPGAFSALVLKLDKTVTPSNVVYSGDQYGIGSAPSVICNIPNGGASFFIDVRLVAANYDRRFLLWVWQSPYDPTGLVMQVGALTLANTPGYADPAWSVSGYTLFAVIANAPANALSPVRAHVRRTQSGVATAN
jgi:hypothetical protein